jgi:hypothetical protein
MFESLGRSCNPFSKGSDGIEGQSLSNWRQPIKEGLSLNKDLWSSNSNTFSSPGTNPFDDYDPHDNQVANESQIQSLPQQSKQFNFVENKLSREQDKYPISYQVEPIRVHVGVPLQQTLISNDHHLQPAVPKQPQQDLFNNLFHQLSISTPQNFSEKRPLVFNNPFSDETKQAELDTYSQSLISKTVEIESEVKELEMAKRLLAKENEKLFEEYDMLMARADALKVRNEVYTNQLLLVDQLGFISHSKKRTPISELQRTKYQS